MRLSAMCLSMKGKTIAHRLIEMELKSVALASAQATRYKKDVLSIL